MAPFDLDVCILLRKRLLHETVLREICAKTKEVLMRDSNVVHVSAPITVVGDIHGQFYDLVEIFRVGGFAPSTNYLFLGFLCIRDLYSLLRGNHESRAVTQPAYTSTRFLHRACANMAHPTYGPILRDTFDLLSSSCVIDDRIFCVHGAKTGRDLRLTYTRLSPSIHSIDQIKVMDRFREVPHEGPMADLVWSDPDPEKEDFAISPRGAGYTFGAGVGYVSLLDGLLLTVWPAPNYYYRCGNSASILEVGPNGSVYFNIFTAAPENGRDGPSRQASQNGQPPEYFLR
ncbi:Metallo-dependent phosphatase-like protein [Mycena sanguinolenta]|nr:Metallo-dependent phosphatase-like protein [Mycena sanguinolenta]